MKKRILSEKSVVVLLFVMVLVTFSLAQHDTKEIEQFYFLAKPSASSQPKQINEQTANASHSLPVVPLR